MADWLGFNGDLDLFSPILSHSDNDPADDPADDHSDVFCPIHRHHHHPADDPANDPPNPADDDDASPNDDDDAADDDSPDDPPRDPQDSIAAAAVQAVSRGPSARRSPGVAEAAKRRQVLLEQAYRQSRSVSERVDGINDQIRNVERGGQNGGGRRGDGVRFAETEEELMRRKMEFRARIMTKASVAALAITAAITIYLATLWTSLPATVQCLVMVTFAWMAGATTSIVLQYLAEGEEGEEAQSQSSAATTSEPWQNKMMKSASITFLLLVSVASYSTTRAHPCSDQFTAVDTYCEGGQTEMDECFSACMAEKGTQDDAIGPIEMLPCPGLADASCVCAKRCFLHSSTDTCGRAMIARLECNLVAKYSCAGHACPISTFRTSIRTGVLKDVAARLHNAGIGEEEDPTSAEGVLGVANDVSARLRKVGMATSASRGLARMMKDVASKPSEAETREGEDAASDVSEAAGLRKVDDA